ncbi:endodeoxyribonuclease [Mortierella sp. GBA35]|nr:endodeoxyribonuclease [Mortierella sp. GBA35]
MTHQQDDPSAEQLQLRSSSFLGSDLFDRACSAGSCPDQEDFISGNCSSRLACCSTPVARNRMEDYQDSQDLELLLYSEEDLAGEYSGSYDGGGCGGQQQYLQEEGEYFMSDPPGAQDFDFGDYETSDGGAGDNGGCAEQQLGPSEQIVPDPASDDFIGDSYFNSDDGAELYRDFDTGMDGEHGEGDGEVELNSSAWEVVEQSMRQQQQQAQYNYQHDQYNGIDDSVPHTQLDVNDGFFAPTVRSEYSQETATPMPHQRLKQSRSFNSNPFITTNTGPTTTAAVPSSSSTTTRYMTTTPRPRGWVLQKFELQNNRLLHDLRFKCRPVIVLASRTHPAAIVYDQETGVIRRRVQPSPDAVPTVVYDDDDDQGEEEELTEAALVMTTKSGSYGCVMKRRKVVRGSGWKGGKGKAGARERRKKKKVTSEAMAELGADDDDGGEDPDANDDTTTTNNNAVSSSSSSTPFTKRTRASKQVSRILRVTELMHENVSKGVISSKRDLYYRDVQAFGCQPTVDRIVEDLACTLHVPRSSLNVVAGSRSVVFGSVRMVVKVPGKRMRILPPLEGEGEHDSDGADEGDSSCAADLRSKWLQEAMANSPFQQQRHQQQQYLNGRIDPLDNRYSQTTYNTLVTIPVNIDDIVEIEIHPRTKFVLVIEKEATFSNLISLGFCETQGPCILLTSKGFPDQAARQLLKVVADMIAGGVFVKNFHFFSDSGDGLSRRGGAGGVDTVSMSLGGLVPSMSTPRSTTLQPPLRIPLLALVDCDPSGIEIYLTYRCGSIQSAYDNANLAVPALKCLGQLPSDWDVFLKGGSSSAVVVTEEDQKNERERRLRDEFQNAFLPLTARDRKKLVKLLTTHPYIRQHTAWKHQISRMLMLHGKTEIQSLHLGDGAPRIVDLGGGDCSYGYGGAGGGEGGSREREGVSSALVLYLQRKLHNPGSWQ